MFLVTRLAASVALPASPARCSGFGTFLPRSRGAPTGIAPSPGSRLQETNGRSCFSQPAVIVLQLQQSLFGRRRTEAAIFRLPVAPRRLPGWNAPDQSNISENRAEERAYPRL